MAPFFSIIIPLYNKANHIQDALKSVLAQSFQNFEILLVNDGSTDASLVNATSIDDARIKIFTIENKGVSNARNYGISKAASEVMVFLDADDSWKPNHLDSLKSLNEKFPDCGMWATAYEYIFDTKTISSDYYKIPKTSKWSGIINDFFESSIVNCIASSSSVMISKKVFDAVGGFNPIYNSGEDIDLWIRIALKYNIAFTSTVSVVINMTAENQATKKSINTRNHLDFETFNEEEKTNQNLKRYLDLNRFSIAIQHKLAGNHILAREMITKIDLNNLNAKQQFLLQMNTPILKRFVKLKHILRTKGIGLNAFR